MEKIKSKIKLKQQKLEKENEKRFIFAIIYPNVNINCQTERAN